MKYKVGEKVILGTYRNSAKAKNKLVGKIATIGRVMKEGNYPYAMTPDNGWLWCDDELKPANVSKIVITINGDETLARLYEDNKVVKTATAKCSPDDTFDFSVGAKLAFDRLMEREVEEKPKYKTGDKVKIIADTCYHNQKIGGIITLKSKLSPERWNFEESTYKYIRECDFEPYEEPVFKVGDLVKVTDTGRRFTSYTKWVENHAPEYLNKYKERNHIKPNDIGVIRVIAPHSEGDTYYGDICLVECSENRILLIGRCGIEKA